MILPADKGTGAAPNPPAQDGRRPLAAGTLRLYARDWADFAAWCRGQGISPVPAGAGQVASYLSSFAGTLGRGALDRRRAAIAHEHRQRGLPPPGSDAALRAIVRMPGGSPARRRTSLPSLAQLPRIVGACPGDLAGLRDRALLLLLLVGRLPRAGLVGLDAERVRFTDAGVDLAIGGADGRLVSVPRSADRLLCPVLALEDWLRVSETRFGPVFRKVDRWGNLEHHPLGSDAVRLVLLRRTARRRAGAA